MKDGKARLQEGKALFGALGKCGTEEESMRGRRDRGTGVGEAAWVEDLLTPGHTRKVWGC